MWSPPDFSATLITQKITTRWYFYTKTRIIIWNCAWKYQTVCGVILHPWDTFETRNATYPSQWLCTSRNISSLGRRFLPTKWRGTSPRWTARSSWTWHSSEKTPSLLCIPPAEDQEERSYFNLTEKMLLTSPNLSAERAGTAITDF